MKLIEIDPISRFKVLFHQFSERNVIQLCPLSGFNAQDLRKIPDYLELKEEMEKLLIAMNVFDQILENKTGYKRHIYFLGDKSVENFANMKIQKDYSLEINNHSYILEVLSSLGLVYRFNVATKFGYPEAKIMQIRLNGWGRQFCEQRKNKKLEQKLHNYWQPLIEKLSQEYSLLLFLCDSTKRPLNVQQIHKFNEMVPIKIVT